MAVVSSSRPDLPAYRESTTTAFPKLVRTLTGIIGKKLTAYVAASRMYALSIAGWTVRSRTGMPRSACGSPFALSERCRSPITRQ
jgi:hypothetical protein